MEGTSIVIRTLNERDHLTELLAVIESQDYTAQKEIIVVDNESTDGTREVATTFGTKLVTIKRDEFSYPKSMNLGVAESRFEIVILIVGHAFPISPNWIESSVQHFNDPNVAGVYCPPIPHRQHSIAEWFVYYPAYYWAKIRGAHIVKRVKGGVFGATNVALRKQLWKQHQFDEQYELGGEDGEWARWAVSNGYYLICEPRFVVRHSHHLNFLGILRQLRYWSRLKNPTKFSRKAHSFRKDLKF